MARRGPEFYFHMLSSVWEAKWHWREVSGELSYWFMMTFCGCALQLCLVRPCEHR
jgi:hypothetical protein